MRCAIYRRVSTDMQVEDGVSLDNQLSRLHAYAESQGWKIVAEFVDEGISAKDIEHRPGVKKMIDAAINNEFDVLLVYKLDRLTRRVKDLHELLQIFEENKVMFKSSTEPFDTTTAAGKLFINMIAAMAEWERETIAERVYSNMKYRAEEGLRNGGPPPYGYDYDDKGNLVVNAEEAKWVRFIFRRYETIGSQNIAKELNKMGIRTKKDALWSDHTVRLIIRNPIYIGKNRWNRRSPVKGQAYTGEEIIKDLKQDGFESIILEEQWNHAQELQKQRSKMAFRSDNHYPFSGVARCAKCGQAFTGANKKRKSGTIFRFYKCAGRFRSGTCDAQAIAEESIEKAFLDLLTLDDVELKIDEKKEEIGMTKEQVEKQVNAINEKKKRTKELYVEGEYNRDEYNEKMEVLKEQENELLMYVEEYEEEASLEEIKQILANIKNEWPHLSHEAKKKAVHSLFKRMTIKVVKPNKQGRNPVPAVVEITEYEFR